MIKLHSSEEIPLHYEWLIVFVKRKNFIDQYPIVAFWSTCYCRKKYCKGVGFIPSCPAVKLGQVKAMSNCDLVCKCIDTRIIEGWIPCLELLSSDYLTPGE